MRMAGVAEATRHQEARRDLRTITWDRYRYLVSSTHTDQRVERQGVRTLGQDLAVLGVTNRAQQDRPRRKVIIVEKEAVDEP